MIYNFGIIFFMKTLVIVPSYNESAIIIELVKEIKRKAPDMDYIVINDASTDITKQLLKLNNINHINLPINLGLTGATRVGMEYAYDNNYDYAIKIDGDGQHNPKAIHYMLKTMIHNDLDIVQMSRYKTKRRKIFNLRTIGSRLISFCTLITTGKYLSDPTNGCHLYNRKLINLYHEDQNLSPEPDTICYLLRNNYKFIDVQFKVRKRTTGRSKFASAYGLIYMLEICVILLFIMPFRPKIKKNKIIPKQGEI